MLIKFIKLVSEQSTYMTSFTDFSNTNNKDFYHQKINNPTVNKVLRLREISLKNRLMVILALRQTIDLKNQQNVLAC
jgi:hypothetical protein